MSKWRPAPLNCIYVVPDIHGRLKELKLICDRILPLRKSDGGKDTLIFLGDYIDRGPDSASLIDFLIDLKEEYGEQVIFLRGNHEQFLLHTFGLGGNSMNVAFNDWRSNGGLNTIDSYLKNANMNRKASELSFLDVINLIPKEHVEFIQSTKLYYETDDYIFVHGGCSLNVPLSEQSEDMLLWDRTLYNYIRIEKYGGSIKRSDNTTSIISQIKKPIVAGHNYRGPFVSDKFIMLDASGSKRLMVLELQSMEMYYAEYDKEKLQKYDLEV